MKVFIILSILSLSLLFFILVIFLSGIVQTDGIDYINLLKNDEFLSALVFTFKSATLATILAFLFGVPIGFYLSRFKGVMQGIFDTVFDIPIVIPPLIVGVLFLSLFNNALFPFFNMFIFNIYGAIVVQFFIALPFTIKLSKAAFDSIPSLYESIAMTLGANYIRAIYDTTFKIAFSGIFSGVVLAFLRCFGEFGATLIVGGGIPGKTENIPINIYINMASGKFEHALAASVITIFFAGIGLFVIRLMFQQKNTPKTS